jgi:hypothetical protein
MPTPRKSLAALKLSGTLARNKAYYAGRIAASEGDFEPIGKSPRHFTAAERATWNELIKAAAPKLLHRNDRLTLEIVVKLLIRVRTTDAKASEINTLTANLAKLGLVPSDDLRHDSEPRPHHPKETPEERAERERREAIWAELDELD